MGVPAIGKLLERVQPATYREPPAPKAAAVADSASLPLKVVAYTTLPAASSFAANASPHSVTSGGYPKGVPAVSRHGLPAKRLGKASAVTGKSVEAVEPETNAPPAESIASPEARSAPLPPSKVP